MKFNDAVNSFLNEEEKQPSRLDRIRALKNVDTTYIIPQEEIESNIATIDDILSSGHHGFSKWHADALKELFKQIRDQYGESGIEQTKKAYTVRHNELIAGLDPDDDEDWETGERYQEEYDFIMYEL